MDKSRKLSNRKHHTKTTAITSPLESSLTTKKANT